MIGKQYAIHSSIYLFQTILTVFLKVTHRSLSRALKVHTHLAKQYVLFLLPLYLLLGLYIDWK